MVEAVAKRLRAAGFPESDIFIGGVIPTKANMVVRYHGTGKLKPILLLAHTDVVEAKREDWSMDPFVFTEKDGYYYGRGTADDKAQAAIWVANLIRYKREGYKPDRDIIVALTADEEGGGPYNGVEWLIKNTPESDRRRPVPQRGRPRRDGERQARLELHAGRREMVSRLAAGGTQTRAATAPCPWRTTPSIIWPMRWCASASSAFRSRPTK